MATPYLDQYGLNLSQKVKQAPEKYQVTGRQDEVNRVLVSLNKRLQNSPILIGEPGVGKTAIVESLALLLPTLAEPGLAEKEIIQIDLAAMMSQDEEFSFKFNQLMKELIENQDRYIPFIDEIHTIVSTGADSGNGLNAGNILKPALSRDDLQLIGATTIDEFHQTIEQDGALMRRFDQVRVDPFDETKTLAVLKQIGPTLAATIEQPEQQLKTVIQHANRFITDRFFPEKAIMLLDSSLSLAKISGKNLLTDELIAQIIHRDYHVPMSVLMHSQDERLEGLADRLRQHVIGQDQAVDLLAQKMLIRSAGLGDLTKPISFLFAGTTGVGKTELAKVFAKEYYGSKHYFLRFDMAEFKEDRQDSYDRFKERLTKLVRENPYAVLLLDEVEKGSPKIWDLLLSVLDDGQLNDEYDRPINFKDLTIIMTTNLGHAEIMDWDARNEAYKQEPIHYETFLTQFKQALRAGGMRDEFIARIGSLIVFNVLKKKDIEAIVRLQLQSVRQKAQQQGFDCLTAIEDLSVYFPTLPFDYELNQDGERVESHPVDEYLAEVGYRPSEGVRPLSGTIDTQIREPLAAAILKARAKNLTGQTFLFRALGKAPDAVHLYGDWRIVYSTLNESAEEDS
ncbi:AAA family ATPase [Fructobacillus fructosus]|uniref:AAA family ATPase n=1 Tax=Fructobacillus fructosus TaxID=1631 RepID=UPI001658B9C8|nr:ATP-dependent Clp protease ATP-binding subunit [Fructobacillus fructosus]MBC9119278.1 ATP-dependent Clp protease ATP-binding subunit [Fructobacillus fructosus]MBD9366966.1 ATP-dependent Clp protease ATP-binding subunit [Leuconostoc mesenteroides]